MAAQVIPLPDYSTKLLTDILRTIVGVDRKIAIGFKNYTDYTLESLGVFYVSGSGNQNIAQQILSQRASLFSARKSRGTARGSVGVFSYFIQDANKTVHVMWSVPFDYSLYSNWWNVTVVDGHEKASNSVYDRLYNGSDGFPKPQKPDQWLNSSSNGFQLLGSMTNNGHATIEVEFRAAESGGGGATQNVIPLPEYPMEILTDILKMIVGVDRKIAIGFKNYTDYTLESRGVFYVGGSGNQDIAQKIPSQRAGLFSAPKSQSKARGTVGVFSYFIQGANKTVHVMWSVPQDYSLYSNLWNVTVVDGHEKASNSVYDRLYNGSDGFPEPQKPDQWLNTSINGFQLLGSMTNDGHATLEVEFRHAESGGGEATQNVIPLPEYSTGLLTDILRTIVGVDRKIAIGFKNYTDYTLESLGVFFVSGSGNQNIVQKIPSQRAGLFSAPKSRGTARRSVGVFSYFIQDAKKTVHVMWSVPQDRSLSSNLWNVTVVDGHENPNNSVYDRLYNGSDGFPEPQSPDQWLNTSSNGFQLLGTMTGKAEATLEVEFRQG